MARIFISYKRDVDPDQSLASDIYARFKSKHHVFIDRTIRVGQDWVRTIEDEIVSADFLVLLLSEHSIQSQMVAEELRMADTARKKKRKPLLLPVRLNFEGPLPYDLGAILNKIQFALWRSSADTEVLFSELESVIAGGILPKKDAPSGAGLAPEVPLPAANPVASLEAAEGTIAPESPFYIERSVDSIAEDEQGHRAYTLTVKGPRQMGKSSLLGRVMACAHRNRAHVAFLDFQNFGGDILRDPNEFYRQFSYVIEDQLGLPSKIEEFWKVPLSAPQKCSRLMERHVLKSCEDLGLLLAIDEADALLDSPFCSDFFGMLRAWHNLRTNPQPNATVWKSFSLAMVISSEPALLISNLSQSPFNVGTILTLEDFSLMESRKANQLHFSPLSETELNELQALLCGHPYLTRKALYLICKGRYGLSDLFTEADSETGPFGDHLRAMLTRLRYCPEILPALNAALSTGHCDADPRHRLIAGGLLLDRKGKLIARNQLYERYFRRVLND